MNGSRNFIMMPSIRGFRYDHSYYKDIRIIRVKFFLMMERGEEVNLNSLGFQNGPIDDLTQFIHKEVFYN